MDATLRQMTFELGYRHGQQSGSVITNRQVSEQFPYMTTELIEVYQNGRDDGVAGDTFRLDLGHLEMRFELTEG